MGGHQSTIDNSFWDLYSELVELVYATVPEERLGIVQPILIERYGQAHANTYQRIENHVLRTVMWMEQYG